MKDLVRKYAIQNAVQHGKAQEKAVLGKVLKENPDLKTDLLTLREQVKAQVKEVNALTKAQQKKELESYSFVEEKKEEGLPELPGAEKGKVVTRFAPAPSGPLNILQVLRAVLINKLYANKYHGRFILRFEDTDPRSLESRYFGMIREDLASLEVEVDREVIQSDHMPLYYKHVESLLEQGKAYVCFCSAADFQLLKKEKKDCPCRFQRPDKNVLGWKGMIEGHYKEGKAVVRFATSMQDPNPAIRDPPIMRIVEEEHPKKKHYRVWPLYNFANVIMDDYCKVTHVFRGKEHEHNTAIQLLLYKALHLEPPIVVNFGMMYLPGEKLHTRHIKEGIREGRYTGWDDPRLPTVRAFVRRGFVPQAFADFAMVCGLSKTDIRIDLTNLEAINRQHIDGQASRFFAVVDPVEIDVGDILKHTGLEGIVNVKNHPEGVETREVAVTKKLLVTGEDYKRFEGREVRLIDLFNVKLEGHASLAKEQEFTPKTPKIQWVPEKNKKIEIVFPTGTVEAVGEQALGKAKAGTILQLVRIGFGRVEKPGVIVFGHK